MTAVFNGRQGGMLKGRTSSIHDVSPTHYHQFAADAEQQADPLLRTETY